MGDDIAALSIKELKALIQRAGLSAADCIDKADLRARAAEADALLQSKAATGATPAASSTESLRTLGGYECLVHGATSGPDGPTADLAIIVLHGLNATYRDFADLPGILGTTERELGAKRVLYAFPQAPRRAIGAAWWDFDVMGMMQAQMTMDQEAIARLIRRRPDGLDACRTSMAALIAEVRALAGGIPPSRVLLAGFSLGAITALDLALQRTPEDAVGGVVFMSGAPIVVDEWAARLKVHVEKPPRVLITHGAADPVLPCMCSGWVRDLLNNGGAHVAYHGHAGGHDLGGPEIIKAIAGFVKETIERAEG